MPRFFAFPVAAVVLLAVLLEPPRGLGAEPVLFVSPEGDDAWSGRLARPSADRSDGPLRTLPKAVERSRQVEAKARRIVLQAGEYSVERPVELGPEDSGLTIEAAEGARVVLYGGRQVRGWRRDGETLWAADLPQVKDGRWDFRLLVADDRLCDRARLPREGTFTHLTEFNVPWMSTTGGGWKRKPTAEELTTMKYRPEDLGTGLEVRNAEVTVYHMWDESVVGVARNDLQNHVLTFSTPCGHPPGAFGVKKYVVWNVREGMSRPGQWYLDRAAGKIVYWPLPGQDLHSAKLLAPAVESIFGIRGRPDQRVRDLTIRGLVLSVTNTPLVSGGFGAGRFPGAVELSHAENCRLARLEIKNVAGQGVKAWNVQTCAIEECHIHDTGACGLKVDGGCLVRNNHVHDVGRVYPSGIAVWANGRGGQSCRIEHNTVHDTPYTAIACGGEDHRIERNRIYRAMQVLHDGAGIYLSMCKRVVLRANYIHDIVDTGGYGASAYYLDEQAEDCLVEGNLSVRVARPSHNHMARKNTLRANVFVCEGDATLTFARSSEYAMEKNVVVAQGAIRVTRPEAIVHAQGNVLFSRSGKVEGIELDDYRQVRSAPLPAGAGWLLVDPKLTDYESGRVEFAPDSPVHGLGIPAMDVQAAGCVARPIACVQSLAATLPATVDFFEVEGCPAFLIRPKGKSASQPMPWVWYAPVIGHPNASHAWMFCQWLDRGIGMAGVDVGESFGSPRGRAVYTRLWETLRTRYRMADRPCLLPQSRGGLMLYNWAAENPSRVACIAGIYTVCDLRSYPGVDKASGAYGLTAAELEARLAEHNPIDRLAPLVKAGVPILHIHGDADRVVPVEKNAGELTRRYRALGGEARLIVIPGKGHEVCDAFFRCQELVEFVAAHANCPN